MKKFFKLGLSAAICAACTLSLLALPACGETEVEYTLSDDGTYYIVSGVSGDRSSLNSLEVPAQYVNPETGVSLPVKEIGQEAFMGCTSLYTVSLPYGIEKIGVRAFMLCGFYDFEIPESVTEIGLGAFSMCNTLVEITIPQSVTTLSAGAFYVCRALEKVYVKANITDLKDKMFYNSQASVGTEVYTNTSLTEVYLSSTITKINTTAFTGNAITDIYFAGTQQQWDELYFYELSANDSGEYVETKLTKSDLLYNIEVHTNATF
jgi:hypothetical protein